MENKRKKLKIISIVLIAAYALTNAYFVYALIVNMVKWLQQPALTNAVTGARSRPMGFFIEFWIFFGVALIVNLIIFLLYFFVRRVVRKKTTNSPRAVGGGEANGVVSSEESGAWSVESGVAGDESFDVISTEVSQTRSGEISTADKFPSKIEGCRDSGGEYDKTEDDNTI